MPMTKIRLPDCDEVFHTVNCSVFVMWQMTIEIEPQILHIQ